MSKTAYFVLNLSAAAVNGFVNSANHPVAEGEILVSSPEDLLQGGATSLQEMTNLFNAITGKNVAKFKCSKGDAAKKVMAVLSTEGLTNLGKLDDKAKAKIAAAPAEKKERKVRDSKLQRMAAAFRETKRGTTDPRQFTVEQLKEKTGIENDGQVSQYISILRNPNDRFGMNIVKEGNKYHLAAAA